MVTIEDIKALRLKKTQLENQHDEVSVSYWDTVKQYVKENATIPEQSFAKAVWVRNGRKYKGVVFVTKNNLYEKDGKYEVKPTFIKLTPIPEKKDDGTGPHYYSEHWEKKRQFVYYDELISIEPYDAPTQVCGKCAWMGGELKGDKLLTGCRINMGYKCDGGKGCACDRFSWWNFERFVGMTHIEYMRKKAEEATEDRYFN